MGYSVDFSGLDKFVNSMKVTRNEYNLFLRDLLVEMAERILARVKPRTPVDTGELRRSWELGELHGSGKNFEIEILNGMEYATEIEYGHRIVVNNTEVGWYNGRFMLKISIDEVEKQIPARYEKEFKTFCQERGLDAN